MLANLLVSQISAYISKLLPEGWENFEMETIFMELGVQYSDLLNDKLNVIRAFKIKPELFYEEPLFFMHCVDVFNGNIADFDNAPSLNSLEVALGLIEASKVLGLPTVEASPVFSFGVRELIKDILVNDGYSKVVWPFDSVGVTGLTEGAWPADTANKEKAIKEYVNGISGKSIS